LSKCHSSDKDDVKLTLLTYCLNTIYQTSNLKRGLINVIRSISRTLVGTMDALIKEQIKLLQNRQLTTQHASKYEIKVLNATIKHIKSLEETIIL